jgi:hypothetical protein
MIHGPCRDSFSLPAKTRHGAEKEEPKEQIVPNDSCGVAFEASHKMNRRELSTYSELMNTMIQFLVRLGGQSMARQRLHRHGRQEVQLGTSTSFVHHQLVKFL